jgi:hypothetical protein
MKQRCTAEGNPSDDGTERELTGSGQRSVAVVQKGGGGSGRVAAEFLEAGPRPKLAGRGPQGGRARARPRRSS